MIRRALFAAAVLGAWGLPGTASAQPDIPNGVGLWYSADLTAYLLNYTNAALSFDGYQIESETKQLDPVGWNSIADQALSNTVGVIGALGAGGLTFGEANPSGGNLAELNLANAGTLQPGAKFNIGKPFGVGGYWVNFYSKAASNPNQSVSQRLYIIPVPEPSTLLLALLAGLALVGCCRFGLVRSLRPLQRRLIIGLGVGLMRKVQRCSVRLS